MRKSRPCDALEDGFDVVSLEVDPGPCVEAARRRRLAVLAA